MRASTLIVFIKNRRAELLQLLYEIKGSAWKKLVSTSLPGFGPTSSNGHKYSLYSMIVSYMTDITEPEDIVFLKRTNMTSTSCYRFQARRDKWALTKGCVAHSIWVLSLLKSKTSVKGLILAYSIFAIKSLLAGFFMSILPYFDIYNISWFDPMRILSLGIPRLLTHSLICF